MFHGKRFALKHLGTLRGRGGLSIRSDPRLVGTVDYEIDGFADQRQSSANGRIEGNAEILRQAFEARTARIQLEGGTSIDVVLANPRGGLVAEIVVHGRIPAFVR